MPKKTIFEKYQVLCEQLIKQSTDITELIENYESFSEKIQHKVNPEQLATLKAKYIHGALQKHHTDQMSDPKNTLHKYMVNELLSDSSLIESINNIPNTHVTINSLCTASIMLAQDHREVAGKYPLIKKAIDNSDLSETQKSSLKELYIAILLPNTIQSMEDGNLAKRYDDISKLIRESSMEEDVKSDLRSRFEKQYSSYSGKKVSAHAVFEKLQSKSASMELSEYSIAQKKAKDGLDKDDSELGEEQSHEITLKDL